MSAQNTSTSDVEWISKCDKNSIQYTMELRKMDERIKSFQPQSKICSKDFKIGMSTFCIEVYPGGVSAEHDMFVGLYLRNKSGWRVKVLLVSFSIPQTDIFRTLHERCFDPEPAVNSSWGFHDMIPHNRCVEADLLSEIGTLTVHLDVDLLEEEVLQTRDPSKELTIERIVNLEQNVHHLGVAIQNMETRLMVQAARQTAELRASSMNQAAKQTADLRRMIQDLPRAQSRLSMLECPVCMEVAKPPMRLKQCGQGHIICDTCQSRAEARASDGGGQGNLNVANCHSCRGMITGRPAALERVLGLI